MSLSHSPKIVTDGLVLCLDAANPRSYPKSGTTWSDLAGSNDGTLTNMTSSNYSDDKRGVLSFDGSDDWVTLGSNSLTAGDSAFSAWGWINTGSSSRQLFFGLDDQNHLDLNAYNTTGRNLSFHRFNRFVLYAPVNNLDLNVPQFVCWTHAGGTANETNSKMYINGQLLSGYSYSYSDQITSFNINTSQSNTISKSSTHNSYSSANRLSGGVYSVSIYNRALTADEVRQNYNATKRRFK